MLGHMLGQIKQPKTAASAHDVVERPIRPDHGAERKPYTVAELHAISRRGLWGILLFLTLSAVTLYCREAEVFTLIPENIRDLFGEPPPIHLLHIALAVSWLSALVLILGRLTGDGKPGYSWYNIGLPTAFYPLYVFSDPTWANFPAVFTAGLILLVVEHVSVLCYASKAIREETDRLNHLAH